MGQYDLVINRCIRVGCDKQVINYQNKKTQYCSKDCVDTMRGVCSNIHNKEMIEARNNIKLRHDEDRYILHRIEIIL